VSRVSAAALQSLADALPERERQIVETVGRLRLVTGSQLERLYFNGTGKAASRERAARRVFADLSEQHILHRLERRIGGVRAGSGGHIYGLGPVGKRLIAYWQGQGLVRVRTIHEPGGVFVRHTLATAEQYVRLIEAERAGQCELLTFDSEPSCWRRHISRDGRPVTLKPDAYVRLGVGEFEQRSFLEVDLGSEGRGALAAKCRYYINYYRSGQEQTQHGVFPRVVWATTNQARVRLLVDVCSALPPEYWQLFQVVLFDALINALTGKSGDSSLKLAASGHGKVYV
jgi:hypothetical protein